MRNHSKKTQKTKKSEAFVDTNGFVHHQHLPHSRLVSHIEPPILGNPEAKGPPVYLVSEGSDGVCGHVVSSSAEMNRFLAWNRRQGGTYVCIINPNSS